jgi:hypothetical protein
MALKTDLARNEYRTATRRLASSLGQAVAAGTAITLLDNTGIGPISGTFANLLPASVQTVGGQAFTVSYSGGTGNDLVLHTDADYRVAEDSPRIVSERYDGSGRCPRIVGLGAFIHGLPTVHARARAKPDPD